jgi:hypothetical protein
MEDVAKHNVTDVLLENRDELEVSYLSRILLSEFPFSEVCFPLFGVILSVIGNLNDIGNPIWGAIGNGSVYERKIQFYNYKSPTEKRTYGDLGCSKEDKKLTNFLDVLCTGCIKFNENQTNIV